MSVFERKHRQPKDYQAIIISMFFILGILFVFLLLKDFSDNYNKIKKTETEQYIKEVSAKNAALLKSKLEQPLELLSHSAVWYSELSESGKAENKEVLNLVLREGSFDAVFYADSKGWLYSSDTAVLDISAYDSFQQAMQGKRNISDVTPYSVLYNQPMISFASPILDWNQQTQGVLYGFYNPEKFAVISSIDQQNENEVTTLIDQKGSFLLSPVTTNVLFASGNFWNNIENAQFEDQGSSTKIQQEMRDGNSGFEKILIDGEQHLLYYEPIGFNQWYAVTTIRKTDLVNTSSSVNQMVMALTTKIIGFLFLFFLSTVVCKHIFQKRISSTNRELIFSEQRFRIAASMTANTIFDYDILTKRISLSDQSGFKTILDVQDPVFPQKLLKIDDLPQKESELIKEIFRNIDMGIETESCIICATQANETTQWYKIKLTSILDEEKNPIHAVGTIEDISQQKHVEKDLLIRAEHDSLTGLYNRKAAIQRIDQVLMDPASQILMENEVHAVLLIDMDNFKLVNDTLGHLVGDQLLVKFSDLLSKKFRKTDTICRLGGDEFLIFLPKMNSPQFVMEKSEDLCIAANQYLQGHQDVVEVSCSIGIAFAPLHGDTFHELYQKADSALYHAKRFGKNRCFVYDGEAESTTAVVLEPQPVEETDQEKTDSESEETK